MPVAARTSRSPSIAGPAPHASALQQRADTVPSPPRLRDSAITPASLPLRAVLLRAAAAFAILATAGTLTYLGWLLPKNDGPRRARMRIAWFAIAALLLSAGHACAWALYATNGSGVEAARHALVSGPGRAELLRIVLCALTVFALLVLRNLRMAAVPAMGAMIVTAAIGHSAAIAPSLLVPINAVHLAGAALWLGGLIMLSHGAEHDDINSTEYARLALRVSVVALTAVLWVALSGIAQTLLVIRAAQLLTSSYGLLALAKFGVLLVLVGFGAAKRFRSVPAVQRGDAAHVLKRTVAWEIAVVAVAFVIAGALAYTAPPEQAHRTLSARILTP